MASLALAAAALTFVGKSFAQAPPPPLKKLEYDPKLKADRFAAGGVEGLLKANGADVPIKDQPKFDAYFQKFVLPPLAMPDRDLPAVRSEIRRNFRMAGSGLAYDRLNQIVRDFMKFLINRPNSTPACRVNAILVLGDLNEFEGTGVKFSKPLPFALDDLIDILKDPKLPDYAKTTALVGVQRHAALSSTYPLAFESALEVGKLMVAMLGEKQVPKSRDPSGHVYVRRTAAEILGEIGEIGKTGAVVELVRDAMNEKDAPLSFRLGLCSAIGNFDYKKNPAAKIDYRSLEAAVCYAAIDAAEKEIARAAQLELQAQKNEVVDPDRRRLSYIFKQLNLALAGADVRNGRTGLATAAAEAASPATTSLGSKKALAGSTLQQLDKPAFIASSEVVQAMLDSLQVGLPKRADAGKLPAEVAGKKAESAK